MTLLQFIRDGVVRFLNANSRNEALHQLVETLKEADAIQNFEQFYDAVLQREQLVSTGIGMGVAIPHAKMENFDHFFLAIGIQKTREGIEWGALDEVPVRLIFMIGGPANQQTEYLKILSRLTTAIKDEKRRMNLLATHSKEEIIRLFENI